MSADSSPAAGDFVESALALMLVLIMGLAAVAWTTDGFAVLTAEAARQRDVARKPVAVSALSLRDQTGHVSVWPRAFAEDQRVTIVTFIYTRCKSICSILNAQYRQMQEQLLASGLQHQVRLLTVSFDPDRDSETVIKTHAQALGVDPDVWRIGRPDSMLELQNALLLFGVVTVPDGEGEFQHNAAWHIVNRQGQLAGIFPVEQADVALDAALAMAGLSGP